MSVLLSPQTARATPLSDLAVPFLAHDEPASLLWLAFSAPLSKAEVPLRVRALLALERPVAGRELHLELELELELKLRAP